MQSVVLSHLTMSALARPFLKKTLLYQLSYFRLYLKKGFEPLTHGLKNKFAVKVLMVFHFRFELKTNAF